MFQTYDVIVADVIAFVCVFIILVGNKTVRKTLSLSPCSVRNLHFQLDFINEKEKKKKGGNGVRSQ